MFKIQRIDLCAPKYEIMGAIFIIPHIRKLLSLQPKELWILTNLKVVSLKNPIFSQVRLILLVKNFNKYINCM